MAVLCLLSFMRIKRSHVFGICVALCLLRVSALSRLFMRRAEQTCFISVLPSVNHCTRTGSEVRTLAGRLAVSFETNLEKQSQRQMYALTDSGEIRQKSDTGWILLLCPTQCSLYSASTCVRHLHAVRTTQRKPATSHRRVSHHSCFTHTSCVLHTATHSSSDPKFELLHSPTLATFLSHFLPVFLPHSLPLSAQSGKSLNVWKQSRRLLVASVGTSPHFLCRTPVRAHAAFLKSSATVPLS